MKPRARTADLTTSSPGDEVVVYDRTNDRVHRLNRSAALVWRACDGERDVAAIGRLVGDELGVDEGETVARLALERLGRVNLLETAAETGLTTRREAILRLGAAAAIALPIVTSILAPRADAASSAPQ